MRTSTTLAALALGAALAVPGNSSVAETLPAPLVSSEWVELSLSDPALKVIDIRDNRDFVAGHVPGAANGMYPDLWRTDDWRLLPEEELAANLSGLGVSAGSNVIVVPAGEDSTEFGGASFAYWTLRYLGHDGVAILDGGMSAWRGDERPLEAGATAAQAAASHFAVNPSIRASTEDVIAALGDGSTILIDARSPEQYRGESKSGLVARAGRIPGALNLPHTEIFDAEAHRLHPAAALRALLPAEIAGGGMPIIVYCNTGHWSSIVWFALSEVLGFDNVRLYDGSMQAWAENPDLPVTTGAP